MIKEELHIHHTIRFADFDIKYLADIINHYGEKIMTAISDFAAQQATFNAAMDTAVADIQAEFATLNTTIANLQAGGVSAVDQASLDALNAHSQALESKLQALDTLNPPAAPVAPAS